MPLITAEEVERAIQERISAGEEWSTFLPKVWDAMIDRAVDRLGLVSEHCARISYAVNAIATCRATFMPATWESPDLVIPFAPDELPTAHNALALLHNAITEGVRTVADLPWGHGEATAQQKRATGELKGFLVILRTMTDTFRAHSKSGSTKRIALVASSFSVITQQCQNAWELFLGPFGVEFTASQEIIGNTLHQVKELLEADDGKHMQ